MMSFKKFCIMMISLMLVMTCVLSLPAIISKYRSVKENEPTYKIEFPILNPTQVNDIRDLLKILNSTTPQTQQQLQTILNSGVGTWTSYVDKSHFDINEPTDEIAAMYQDAGTFIIKYEKSSGSDTYDQFVMYSTQKDVSELKSGDMVIGVYKTTFATDETGKYYAVQSIEGEALSASPSYNTDYWAAKMVLGAEFNVDLNLSTDGDPGTNHNNQHEENRYYGDVALIDGYTFIVFTPDVSGSYTVDADKAFRIRYREDNLNKLINDNRWGGGYSATEKVPNGQYTIYLTAGTKYYFAIQMPSDADTANPYPVTISISKN